MAHTVQNLKIKIMDYVRENDLITFSQLVDAIPGAEGEYGVQAPGRNLIFWVVSDPAATAFAELWHDQQLFFIPVHPALYALGGKTLKLPIARSIGGKRGFASPRWMPVVLTVHHPLKKLPRPVTGGGVGADHTGHQHRAR